MNELYHVHGFKYVKREWKNGKWNYYYDNGKGKSTSLGLVNKISDWIGEDEKENARRANTRASNAAKAYNTAHSRRTSSVNTYKVSSSKSEAYERAHAQASQNLDRARSRLRVEESLHDLAKKNPGLFIGALENAEFNLMRYISNATEYGFASYIAKQNPNSVAYSSKPVLVDDLIDMKNWPASDKQAYETALRGVLESRMNAAKDLCNAYGPERVTSRIASESRQQTIEYGSKAGNDIRSDINAKANAREAQRAADNANALYESTFIGKAEKGLNWIKNLFK